MQPNDYMTQPESWCTVPGMYEFANACKRTPQTMPQHWSTIAFAQQVARALADPDLARWTVDQAVNKAVRTGNEEIYQCYVLGGCVEDMMKRPGEAGHWLAAQNAEAAWFAGDNRKLYRCVDRLEDLPPNPTGAINHGMSLSMWRFMATFAETGQFHVSRLQEVGAFLTPVERNGFVLHLWRVRNKIHLGEA